MIGIGRYARVLISQYGRRGRRKKSNRSGTPTKTGTMKASSARLRMLMSAPTRLFCTLFLFLFVHPLSPLAHHFAGSAGLPSSKKCLVNPLTNIPGCLFALFSFFSFLPFRRSLLDRESSLDRLSLRASSRSQRTAAVRFRREDLITFFSFRFSRKMPRRLIGFFFRDHRKHRGVQSVRDNEKISEDKVGKSRADFGLFRGLPSGDDSESRGD